MNKNYETAKQTYAAFGVDTDAAIAALKTVPVSVHCWQGDDVLGFEGAESLSGGIQTTGNYPGRAPSASIFTRVTPSSARTRGRSTATGIAPSTLHPG